MEAPNAQKTGRRGQKDYPQGKCISTFGVQSLTKAHLAPARSASSNIPIQTALGVQQSALQTT
jgi:hypothetical protein